jgi:hypothetical protein
MNDILTTLSALVGIISPLLTFAIFIFFKKQVLAEAEDMITDFIDRGKAFYAAEKADIAQSIPQMVGSLLSPVSGKMSDLGQMSGLSRQLKGLEKELIADGVDSAIGVPGLGGMAAKYIQKYPILMQILPNLIQQFTNKAQVGDSSQNMQKW